MGGKPGRPGSRLALLFIFGVELGQATPDSHSTAQEKLVSFKAAAGEAASFQSRQGAGQGCERGLVSSPRIPAGTAGVRGDQTLSSLKRKEGG